MGLFSFLKSKSSSSNKQVTTTTTTIKVLAPLPAASGSMAVNKSRIIASVEEQNSNHSDASEATVANRRLRLQLNAIINQKNKMASAVSRLIFKNCYNYLISPCESSCDNANETAQRNIKMDFFKFSTAAFEKLNITEDEFMFALVLMGRLTCDSFSVFSKDSADETTKIINSDLILQSSSNLANLLQTSSSCNQLKRNEMNYFQSLSALASGESEIQVNVAADDVEDSLVQIQTQANLKSYVPFIDSTNAFDVYLHFIGCIVLATKNLCDEPFDNYSFAYYAGISIQQLNAVEVKILKNLDWQFSVQSNELESARLLIVS